MLQTLDYLVQIQFDLLVYSLLVGIIVDIVEQDEVVDIYIKICNDYDDVEVLVFTSKLVDHLHSLHLHPLEQTEQFDEQTTEVEVEVEELDR